MANIKVDLADFGVETHPDDRIVLWAPVMRGSAFRTGGIVSTRPRYIPLEQGLSTGRKIGWLAEPTEN